MRPSPLRLMDHREFPLLYVDDEPDNLRVFELTFRRDFTIFTATSAEAGLRILNDNPIAVVLSDHKMPGMTGVEFLARVRAIDPQTVRMLVTAYGDAETLGTAINDGSIYRYVPKPWDPDDLRLTIRRGIEAFALDRERDALIRELTHLNQLSRDLHRELDLSRVVGRLLTATTEEMGFDAAALLFFDDAGDALEWGGIEPRDDVAEALCGLEIARSNAREFIEDLELGSRPLLRADQLDELPRVLREWLTEVSAEEILVVPLNGARRVIGAIAVDNRRGGGRLGADDQVLLDGIATQAVVAIENARIVEALRQAEVHVKRSDRIGTLGEVAGTLAREIEAPLDDIERAMMGTASPTPPDVEKTTHPVARLRELVRAMARASAGSDEVLREEVSLADLVDRARGRVRDDFNRAGLRLECEEVADDLRVAGVRSQLLRLLVNLLDNARDATPAGGRVELRCEREASPGGDTVAVRIRDTGRGIPEADLEKIFDPFFTTAESREGRGLGLTVCQQIVDGLAGDLEVQSLPGEGTTFVVRLPLKAARRLSA